MALQPTSRQKQRPRPTPRIVGPATCRPRTLIGFLSKYTPRLSNDYHACPGKHVGELNTGELALASAAVRRE